ncbi:MAG: hypothetical protein FJX77_13965 [Armatimonadetes bacterium]|nr:hypothetical protein [Armatimonadota bacterium]
MPESPQNHSVPSPPIAPCHPRLGIPELAGVCTYAEAARPGFGVEENVRRLKRFNWVETRLTDLMLTQLATTPEWEVKEGLCLHVWLDAEHARALQERVGELRHPPHHFHVPPDPALDACLEEALRSRDTVELLTAIYRVFKPALLEAYRRHWEQTHALVDHPTRRILRFAMLEEEEMLAWGEAALVALLTSASARAASAAWQSHLEAYLAAAGGVDGTAPTREEPLPEARAVEALEPDWTPRRDARFESFNYHFPPHWIYAQRDRPAPERNLALVCKRLLEMDVPEMMAAIIWRARREAAQAGRPKPWDYTADMCRQIWDEARHSMMGQCWLVARGVDFTRVPLNIGFSLGLNQLATAREAHAALYWIEQGLMPRTTGKAYEWRTARESGDSLSQLFMDYDWADEVLHVHIGRRWLVREIGAREEAEQVGSAAFSRVMAVRRRHGLAGAVLTEQREWWPDFCEGVLGFRPEPLAPEVYETPDEDAPWLKNA